MAGLRCAAPRPRLGRSDAQHGSRNRPPCPRNTSAHAAAALCHLQQRPAPHPHILLNCIAHVELSLGATAWGQHPCADRPRWSPRSKPAAGSSNAGRRCGVYWSGRRRGGRRGVVGWPGRLRGQAVVVSADVKLLAARGRTARCPPASPRGHPRCPAGPRPCGPSAVTTGRRSPVPRGLRRRVRRHRSTVTAAVGSRSPLRQGACHGTDRLA